MFIKNRVVGEEAALNIDQRIDLESRGGRKRSNGSNVLTHWISKLSWKSAMFRFHASYVRSFQVNIRTKKVSSFRSFQLSKVNKLFSLANSLSSSCRNLLFPPICSLCDSNFCRVCDCRFAVFVILRSRWDLLCWWGSPLPGGSDGLFLNDHNKQLVIKPGQPGKGEPFLRGSLDYLTNVNRITGNESRRTLSARFEEFEDKGTANDSAIDASKQWRINQVCEEFHRSRLITFFIKYDTKSKRAKLHYWESIDHLLHINYPERLCIPWSHQKQHWKVLNLQFEQKSVDHFICLDRGQFLSQLQ